MRILGMGSKQREVFLSDEALEAIDFWLENRNRKMGLFLPESTRTDMFL